MKLSQPLPLEFSNRMKRIVKKLEADISELTEISSDAHLLKIRSFIFQGEVDFITSY